MGCGSCGQKYGGQSQPLQEPPYQGRYIIPAPIDPISPPPQSPQPRDPPKQEPPKTNE